MRSTRRRSVWAELPFHAPAGISGRRPLEVLDCLKAPGEEQKKPSDGNLRIGWLVLSWTGPKFPFEGEYDEQAVLNGKERGSQVNMGDGGGNHFCTGIFNGVLAGSICTVHCNRATDQWFVDFEAAQKDTGTDGTALRVKS